MRRHSQRKQARASGAGIARDIPVPLPLRGVFSETKTAEISGMYAAELNNWVSNGFSLEFRKSFSLDGLALQQRIPFEFRSNPDYIKATSTRLSYGVRSIDRTFVRPFMAAYISGNAILVDGAGPPVLFNGDVFSEATYTTSTGKSQNDFDGAIAHHDRVFAWQTGDELDFYYGDVGALTGQLTRFPLGRLGNITGTIVGCRSMTLDAGNDVNDVLAIFTSTGWIVIYEGLDPGDPTNWRQISRIKVATPISRDAFMSVGADMWMLTTSGVVSVLQSLREAGQALVSTISRPVQKQIVADIKEGGTWSMHLSADAKDAIVNRVFGGSAKQYVYDTETKAWQTKDYPASIWHNLGGETHFTSLTGNQGSFDDGSEQITARWVSSWFRMPKRSGITYLHPTIIATGAIEAKFTILTDHDATQVDITESEQTVTLTPDEPGDKVALNEVVPVDAHGMAYQIIMEITAPWAELVSMNAGVV